MKAKKIIGTILCAAMAITALTGCSAGSGKNKVGVSMPTKDLQRWNQDGDNMKKELEAAGYEVDLQYANNDVATQLSQVENMINSGCKVLVIAAIEGSSLGTALDKAAAKKIPVIAYDRLLTGTLTEQADRDELQSRLRPVMEQLPRGQQISNILFVNEPLPRTASGKIKRWEIQQKVGTWA